VTGRSMAEFDLSINSALNWIVSPVCRILLAGDITMASNSWVTLVLSSQDQNKRIVIIKIKILFNVPPKHLWAFREIEI
jgi:hypothetical protein